MRHRLAGWLRSVGLGRLRRADLSITPYCGWGTPSEVELQGRVLVPRRPIRPQPGDRPWRNLAASLGRLWSLEVPGVPVVGELAGLRASAVSDGEGFFTLRFTAQEPLAPGWHRVALEMPGRPRRTRGRALVVDGAPFGVISDLDDTVVQTGATKLLAMLFTVLTRNARTRLPFPGVGALYRALSRRGCPVFYVSSSPWNFFDVLWQFLDYRRIPLGPLFLRDWGLDLLRGHGRHKLGIILRVMERYPGLPFVLVGDSGERDPEIYAEVVRHCPGRVLAVYIRDVAGRRREPSVARLRDELRAQGVPMLLARDSLAAAHHAMALGLIAPEDLRHVAQAAVR